MLQSLQSPMLRLASSFFLLLVVSGELFGATLSGKVTYLTKRGQRINPRETLIWLEPLDPKSRKGAPGAKKSEPTVLLTRSKVLEPHVVAIPAGSSVQFPNEDPISHNLFSVSPSNSFDLGLYRKGAGKTMTFHKPGVVNVYCNVHPNMSAVIHVMEVPWYAFADADAKFTLADVPEGRYRLTAWSEQAGTFQQEIVVSSDVISGLNITVDGRSFRAAPHLNKHGKPYQGSGARDY